MDPLVVELRKIYSRIREIEIRIVKDDTLCQVVRECGRKIHRTLNPDQNPQQGQPAW